MLACLVKSDLLFLGDTAKVTFCLVKMMMQSLNWYCRSHRLYRTNSELINTEMTSGTYMKSSELPLSCMSSSLTLPMTTTSASGVWLLLNYRKGNKIKSA